MFASLSRRLKRRPTVLVDGKSVALDQHFSIDTHLRAVLDLYCIDLVIDVGANEGQFGTRLREQGFAGPIHSFEPVGAVLDILRPKAAIDGDWTVHACALGEASGELTFNIAKATDLSSALLPSDYGRARYRNIAAERQEIVPVRRLDEALPEAALRGRRVFLKMDTQGFDLAVFRGASGILGQVCGLLSEVAFIPIYQGMPDGVEALATYRAAGFDVSGLYPVSRNKRNFALIEMDCVMVRQAALPD